MKTNAVPRAEIRVVLAVFLANGGQFGALDPLLVIHLLRRMSLASLRDAIEIVASRERLTVKALEKQIEHDDEAARHNDKCDARPLRFKGAS